MNKPRIFRVLACTLLAAAFAAAGALATPVAGHASETVEVTNSMASYGAIALSGDRQVKEITYTITYDADGASVTPSPQLVSKGERVSPPSTPYKEGFEFTGWYEGESETPFNFNEPITSDHTLTAHYKQNTSKFKVTFDAGDGQFSDGTTQLLKTYTYGELLSNQEPEELALEGKYFDGWATKDGEDFPEDQGVTSDLELHAKWVGPEAQCDGTNYRTLQAAINAAKAAATGKSTVTLLRDVDFDIIGDTVAAGYANGVDGLTIDLNGHTVSIEGLGGDDLEDSGVALVIFNCENAVIKNGKVRANDATAVAISGCENYQLIDLDVETTQSTLETEPPIAACPVVALESGGSITDGKYVSKGSSVGLYLFDSSTTINSGTFVGPTAVSKYGDDAVGVAVVSTGSGSDQSSSSLTIKGGDFSDYAVAPTGAIEVMGGSFGSFKNAADVVSGYAMIKRAGENGRYEVVKAGADGTPAGACWKATVLETNSEDEEDTNTFVVYFEDTDEAKAFKSTLEAEGYDDDFTYKVTLDPLGYKVSFDTGEGASECASQVVAAGQKATKPADPTRSGYKFVEWDDASGVAYDFDSPVTSDMTLTAKWLVANPVATCDGVGYATLQEALDAAKDGSTVTLLRNITLENTSSDSGVTCAGVKNLTLDLGMHEITYSADADDEKEALRFTGCENLVIKNGYIEATGADAIYLDECQGFELSTLDVEAKGGYGGAIVTTTSGGKILSGSYEGASDDYALWLNGGSVEILGGFFAGGKDEDDEATASVYLSASPMTTLTVSDGTFFGAIEGYLGDLSISGGSFDGFWNAPEVDEGYAMLKRAGESGMYEVVAADDEGIPADAFWRIVATAEGDEKGTVLGAFYFEDGSEAKEVFEECEKESEAEGVTLTLEQLRYTVKFVSRNEDVGTRVIRAGKAVGELPAGEEVAGWTFSGWYDGDTKVDETFVPTGDVTLVAKWVENGSGEESDDPEDEGDDSGKGDEADKGGKSDKAMPQTGDTTNAVLPVCIAIAGVLVCALGLLFKARKHK